MDADGYLTTGSGMVLMGWPARPDGTIPSYPRDTQDGLEAIKFDINQFRGEPTTRIMLGANLPATDTETGSAGEMRSLPVEYYDNLGTSQNIVVEFTPTVPATGSSNSWTMVMRDTASENAIVGEYTLTFEDSRDAGGTLAAVDATTGGAYDPTTGSVIVNAAGGPIEVVIGQIGENDGLTQFSDQFAPVSISRDGEPVGNMVGVEIDAAGMVHAKFDTGATRVMYQVPLVDQPNLNGLMSLGDQTYAPSPESGAFFLWDAGDGPTGSVASYAREESATDVATELTAMIQTQRAYSSNAKVIQTVDEMLQETTNIKR